MLARTIAMCVVCTLGQHLSGQATYLGWQDYAPAYNSTPQNAVVMYRASSTSTLPSPPFSYTGPGTAYYGAPVVTSQNYPVAILLHGYGPAANSQDGFSQMATVGYYLVNQGYVVVIYNDIGLDTGSNAVDYGHDKMFRTAKWLPLAIQQDVANNSSSPIYQAVNTSTFAVVGFSMGGATAIQILADGTYGSNFTAGTCLAPYTYNDYQANTVCLCGQVSHPMLLVSGYQDGTSPPVNVQVLYSNLTYMRAKWHLPLHSYNHSHHVDYGVDSSGTHLRLAMDVFLGVLYRGDAVSDGIGNVDARFNAESQLVANGAYTYWGKELDEVFAWSGGSYMQANIYCDDDPVAQNVATGNFGPQLTSYSGWTPGTSYIHPTYIYNYYPTGNVASSPTFPTITIVTSGLANSDWCQVYGPTHYNRSSFGYAFSLPFHLQDGAAR